MPADSNASSLDDLLRQAEEAERAGNNLEADELAQRAQQIDPDNVPARIVRAVVAGKQGNPEAAILLLREALAIDPASEAASDKLSNLYRFLGNIPEAAKVAQDALRHNPNSASAHANLGRCLLMSGRLAEARAELEAGISLDGSVGMHHHLLADVHFLQGRNLAAKREYEKAVALDPNLVSANLRLAKLRLLHGEYEAAADSCGDALMAQSILPEAHAIWAEALYEMGEEAEANAHLAQAETLAPASTIARAFRLKTQGRFRESAEAFETAAKEAPLGARGLYGLVTSRQVTDEDRPLVDRMLALVSKPETPVQDKVVLHFALGKCFDDLGDYATAMKHYHEANGTAARSMPMGFDSKRIASSHAARIRAYSKTEVSKLSPVGSESEMPVLVVGMPMSGVALVQELLSRHPHVRLAGELRFWDEVDEGFMAALADRSAGRETVQAIVADYLQILERIAHPNSGEGEGAKRVVDGSPVQFLHLGLFHIAFPKARIIHCSRDATDNCVSIYRTFFDTPPPFVHDADNLVFYYREYERLMNHWKGSIPAASILEVRLEELQDQSAAAKRMLDFLGLEWSEAMTQERRAASSLASALWHERYLLAPGSIGISQRYASWLGPLAGVGV